MPESTEKNNNRETEKFWMKRRNGGRRDGQKNGEKKEEQGKSEKKNKIPTHTGRL